MSHLACADEPDHPMNYQLETLKKMTDRISAPRSLSATGGSILRYGPHFDLTSGIGLYGGHPV
jgi:alanine racemase